MYELGGEVRTSRTPVLQRYGVSDDDAFAVGLTCGGILDVYVEKVDRFTFPELGAIADDIAHDRPVEGADEEVGEDVRSRLRFEEATHSRRTGEHVVAVQPAEPP